MKILMVCLRYPYPPSDGGIIAMYNMAQALKKAGAEVKIIAFNTRKHFVNPEKVPNTFFNDFRPEAVYLDASVKPIPALVSLLSGNSYNISRFDIPEFDVLLQGVFEKGDYDFVQLESLFCTPYIATIRKYSKAKIVLRAHNVEYVIWERLAQSVTNPIKKWYLNFLAARLKKYELTVVKKLDAIITLTYDDKAIFERTVSSIPTLVSPIGLDVANYIVNKNQVASPSIFHLGSMDWLPNIEAVEWFLKNIYPKLKENHPEIVTHLAGKNMPDKFFEHATDSLLISGRVDNSKEFMNDKPIMIVPLLSGGGMRVKIIEGFALGKTIISTTIGAEGIKYENEKNIIIADTPEEFYNAIVKCVSDQEYCSKIGKAARMLAEEVYENKIVGKEIINFYSAINSKASAKDTPNNFNEA